MKTHINFYYNPDDPEDYIDIAECGTPLGENFSVSHDWADVDCKRCLANRELIDKRHAETEKIIVQQMGDMADFFAKENK